MCTLKSTFSFVFISWVINFNKGFAYCVPNSSGYANTCSQRDASDTTVQNITLLALVPCDSHNSTSRDCHGSDVFVYQAVRLAQEFINNRSSSFYRGKSRTLGICVNIEAVETGRNLSHSVFSYITTIPTNENKQIHGIVGPEKSDEAEVIAYISGQKNSTVSVSYGAADTVFTKMRARYPYFHRTLPSSEAVNIGILKLMRDMDWKRAAVLSSADPTNSRSAENFVRLAKHLQVMITFVRILSFDLQAVFEEWNKTNVKIIVGMFSPRDARKVMCEAYHFLGGELLDESHAWILPHYQQPMWWKQKYSGMVEKNICSDEIMKTILEFVLFVDTLKYNVFNAESDSDSAYHLSETVTSFVEKIKADESDVNMLLRQSRAAAAFDAVVALALAYDEVLRVDELALEHQNTSLLNETLSNLKFSGLANFHHFSKSQDLQFCILVTQGLMANPVSIISGVDTDINCTTCCVTMLENSSLKLPGYNISDYSPFVWKGNGPPSDGVLWIQSHISIAMFIANGVVVLLVLCIIFAFALSMILCYKNSHIKATSPKFMILMIIGVLTILPSSTIYGLTVSRAHYKLGKAASDNLCILEPILTNTGFVLAFSILVVKQWRVYRIFNSTMKTKLEGISDPLLLLLVVVLVVPYLIILTLWLTISTPTSLSSNTRISPTTIIEFTNCGDEQGHGYYWIAGVAIYVALLLIMLLYFSLKNSQISAQLRAQAEEGQAGTRLVFAVTIMTFLEIFILTFLQINFVANYVPLFWVHVMYTSFSSSLYLGVIFIPKYIIMYCDRVQRKKEIRYNRRASKLSIRMSQMQMEASQLKAEIKQKEEKLTLIRSQLSSTSIG